MYVPGFIGHSIPALSTRTSWCSPIVQTFTLTVTSFTWQADTSHHSPGKHTQHSIHLASRHSAAFTWQADRAQRSPGKQTVQSVHPASRHSTTFTWQVDAAHHSPGKQRQHSIHLTSRHTTAFTWQVDGHQRQTKTVMRFIMNESRCSPKERRQINTDASGKRHT